MQTAVVTGVVDHHLATALAAAQQALQQRRALAGRSAAAADRQAVGTQSLLGGEVLIPGHVAGMMFGYADGPLLHRHLHGRDLHVAVCVDGLFGIAAASEEFMLRALDAHTRRRLRAIVLKHWKRQRTIARNLIALGVKPQSAWHQIYAGRKSTWTLSHSPAVDKAMPTVFFTERGLIRLVVLHRRSRRNVVAPIQPRLALEWG